MDMFDLLAHRARVTPERPALEDLESGERYNYAQFNERAARLAAAAREHWGLEEGDRLAYLCLLYTSPSPRDRQKSRMPSSA